MIVLKNNYVEGERLFSTGNDELDDILEEVYYSGIEDGYDYAQREFAEKRETQTNNKGLSSRENKAAISTGAITLSAGSLAAEIANEIADKKANKRYKKSLKAIEKNLENAEARTKESVDKEIQNLKKAAREQMEKVPKASPEEVARVEKANKYILEGPNRPIYDALKLNLDKGSTWLEKTSEEKEKEAIKESLKKDIDKAFKDGFKKNDEALERALKQNDEAFSRLGKRIDKNAKIGNKRKLIAVAASVPAALVAREVVKRKNKKD